MAVMIRNNFLACFNANIETLIFQEHDKVPKMREKFYKIKPSKRPDETFFSLGTFGLPQSVPEGDDIPMDRIYGQYEKTITHGKFGSGFQVTQELLDDDQSNKIEMLPTALGMSFANKTEIDAASIFNHANDTTVFTGPDGVSLVSTAHPTLSPDGITQSNKGTAALNYDNLITAMNTFKALRDDRGNLVNATPDILLVPQALWKMGETLVGTEGKPGTADNDKNVVKGMLKLVVWPRLDDNNNWFLLDSSKMKSAMGLVWYDRTKFHVSHSSNQNKDIHTTVASERRSFGFNGWQFIYGSIVA